MIRDLHRRKGRQRRGLALAEGIRLVEEMLSARADCKSAVVSPALLQTPRGVALRETLAARVIFVEEVSDEELADLAATEHPQGVVAIYAPRPWTLNDIAPGRGRPVVVLDAVQDPGNVGTIARTALAFGAAGLVALPGTAELTNPKTLRASMGALFHLPHVAADDQLLFEFLDQRGVALWATTMHGDASGDFRSMLPLALALGNEGAGIREELRTRAVRELTIPIQREAESLNVSVAAGILLYQITR